MKIDITSIKTQLKEQSTQIVDAVNRKMQNQDNKLNKLGYSILAFVLLYNAYMNIYWYSFFTYSLWEYITDFILLIFFSYILWFFVLNTIFTLIIITFGEQLTKLVEFIFKKH